MNGNSKLFHQTAGPRGVRLGGPPERNRWNSLGLEAFYREPPEAPELQRGASGSKIAGIPKDLQAFWVPEAMCITPPGNGKPVNRCVFQLFWSES